MKRSVFKGMSSKIVRNNRKKYGLFFSLGSFPLLPYCIWVVIIWVYAGCLVYALVDITGCASHHQNTSALNDGVLLNGCSIGCQTPFGTILGAHDGVFAYSNCNSTTCISQDFHGVRTLDSTGVHRGFNTSGMRWQCVEYARRYWMIRGISSPASFASVEGANDIWSLKNVQLKDGSSVPLLKYANGAEEKNGGSAPRVGDLLIYPRQEGGFPYGHVAVIVGVTEKSVLVAEQNWDNEVWPAPYHNYSREIPLHHSSDDDSYRIHDEGVNLLGWVRYSSQ